MIRSRFAWLTIVPFDAERAFVAGRLEAPLHTDESVGQDEIDALTGDVLVAAVAKDLGATVVTKNATDSRFDYTKNATDFDYFAGVEAETY